MWNQCLDGANLGLGGPIMMILWIAVIAAVVYILIRTVNTGSGGGSVSETALDVLKKRYARGELSKEEFEEKKKDIQT